MMGAAILVVASLFAPQVVVVGATPEQEQVIRDAWALTLNTYSHQGCSYPKGVKVKVTGPNFPVAGRYYAPGALGRKAKVKVNPYYVADWVLVHEFGHHWDAICLTSPQRYEYSAAVGESCWGCGGSHAAQPREIWAEDFRIGAGVEGVGTPRPPSLGFSLLGSWFG